MEDALEPITMTGPEIAAARRRVGVPRSPPSPFESSWNQPRAPAWTPTPTRGLNDRQREAVTHALAADPGGRFRQDRAFSRTAMPTCWPWTSAGGADHRDTPRTR